MSREDRTREPSRDGVASIYLDADSKAKLQAMAAAAGTSRSLVVRNLIQEAGSADKVKLRKIVTELSKLVNAT